MPKRYWFAEVHYPGFEKFFFFASGFSAIAEFETEAQEKLQAIVDREWAKICPYPAPRLTAVIPGRLVVEVEGDFLRMDDVREAG